MIRRSRVCDVLPSWLRKKNAFPRRRYKRSAARATTGLHCFSSTDKRPLTGSQTRSAVLNFAQEAGRDVVDKPANGDFFRNPRMGAQLLQLVADVLVNILEGVKKGRRNGSRARAILDARAQILFAGVHQATIGVVDDHELFG